MKRINYSKIINERHENKTIVNLKLKRLLYWFLILGMFNIIIYYFVFWNYVTNISFLYNIKIYIYWFMLFNNVLLSITIINIYFLIKENFIVKKYDWERKSIFDWNWELIKYK